MTALTRRGFLWAGVAAGAIGLAGCSPAPPRALTLACGEPGGSYLQFGELMTR